MEWARRVLFSARHEASQRGSVSIEAEHLLLGSIREGKGLMSTVEVSVEGGGLAYRPTGSAAESHGLA